VVDWTFFTKGITEMKFDLDMFIPKIFVGFWWIMILVLAIAIGAFVGQALYYSFPYCLLILPLILVFWLVGHLTLGKENKIG